MRLPRFPEGRAGIVARVLAVGLGAFVAGYLLVWIVFFPGLGRDAIVTVPDVRNQRLPAAARVLEGAGLTVERGSTLANPTVPAGAVLAQTPLPGQEVMRGAAVQVILSSGPERHPVPSVRGMRAKRAAALLEAYGFTVAIQEVEDASPEGTILEMTPAAGAMAVVPSEIRMRVSAGPPWVEAPGVVGMERDAARAALEAAGLRVGDVGYDPYALAEPGVIVSQSPAAGDSIRQGSGVGIVVAGTDPTPAPEPADTLAPPGGEEPEEPAPAPAAAAVAPALPRAEGGARG